MNAVRYHMGTMRRSRAPHVTHRQPSWLLVCAMLALSVHALANMGLMPAREPSTDGAAKPFFAEICTGQGKLQLGPNALREVLADADFHEADWCELCSLASGPALTSAELPPVLDLGQASRPATQILVPPAQAEWVLQAPRGPPLLG